MRAKKHKAKPKLSSGVKQNPGSLLITSRERLSCSKMGHSRLASRRTEAALERWL